MSAKGHVWTAPGWQELFSRLQRWSVRPCVRPFSAVLMTAGHNALRGSGPNRKHAFKDATTQTGSPDPRIDAGGKLLNPVALPPGRGKLATNPLPTGSPTCTKTTGKVRVSWSTAAVGGVVSVRI